MPESLLAKASVLIPRKWLMAPSQCVPLALTSVGFSLPTWDHPFRPGERLR